MTKQFFLKSFKVLSQYMVRELRLLHEGKIEGAECAKQARINKRIKDTYYLSLHNHYNHD